MSRAIVGALVLATASMRAASARSSIVELRRSITIARDVRRARRSARCRASSGTARLAVVQRERAEHAAVVADDRRRPARAQAVRQRELAVLGPQRIGRDVGRRTPARGGTPRCRTSPPSGRSRGRRARGCTRRAAPAPIAMAGSACRSSSSSRIDPSVSTARVLDRSRRSCVRMSASGAPAASISSARRSPACSARLNARVASRPRARARVPRSGSANAFTAKNGEPMRRPSRAKRRPLVARVIAGSAARCRERIGKISRIGCAELARPSGSSSSFSIAALNATSRTAPLAIDRPRRHPDLRVLEDVGVEPYLLVARHDVGDVAARAHQPHDHALASTIASPIVSSVRTEPSGRTISSRYANRPPGLLQRLLDLALDPRRARRERSATGRSRA